jgi:hypothetical protein
MNQNFMEDGMNILLKIIGTLFVVLFFCSASAEENVSDDADESRHGGYKRVSVYCIGPNGTPLQNCRVEFKSHTAVQVPCSPQPCACYTAYTGFCEKLLRCCGHQGSPPQIQWTINVSSIYGEKSDYFWSSCGWMCGETKTVRFVWEE